MRSFIRLGVLVVAATLGTAQAAFAHDVPADIAVPNGNELYLKAHAVGVQIYSCNGTAWTLSGPRADLYDRRGKLLGTHFAGPTWQAKDGSKVVAARMSGVNVDPRAIDWLLLSATSTTPGRFGATTFIQRVNTTGGLVPAAADCNATTTGTVKEVSYTADYHFWKARHRCKD
jgi:Protein of unknown function (DUF3455)